VGGSGPRKKTGSSHPTSSPVPTSSAEHGSPATDSRQHLITLWDQLHSVLRSNPSRENGVSGGKRKLGILTDRLVCIVYECSGFMLVFSRLTNKLILDVTVSPCTVIHDYMHIRYISMKNSFPKNVSWHNTRQRKEIFLLKIWFSQHAMDSVISGTS